MAEPTFRTRADLEAWAKVLAAKAKTPKQQLAALSKIRAATVKFMQSEAI